MIKNCTTCRYRPDWEGLLGSRKRKGRHWGDLVPVILGGRNEN